MSAKSQFWAGVKAEIPIVIGVLPFGFIFGVLAINSGLSPLMAWSTSSIIFAGSAQFLAMPLIEAGTPSLILIMTAFIINLRHLLYSATLAPFAENLPLRWKIGLSYLLTDEAFAPTALHYQNEDEPIAFKHWFWLGAGLTLWVQWQISTGIGIFFGAQLPEIRGLEFTLSLTFIGMIVPSLVNKPLLASAVAGGLTAVLTYSLPYKLNLMVAAIVGIAVGLWLEMRSDAHE